MKAEIYPLEQKLAVEGSPVQIAHLYGYLLDVMSQLAPKLKERSEELEGGKPESTIPPRSDEVDRLLDWMIDHGIVPPGDYK